MSQAEDILAVQLTDARILYIREYAFHPTRRWRYDFAFLDARLAVEVEGGLSGAPIRCQVCGNLVRIRTKDGRSIPMRQSGRHNVGKGFKSDLEKYQESLLLGWRVLRVSVDDVKHGRALQLIQMLLAMEAIRV